MVHFDALEIMPLDKPPLGTVRVPGSKSITNRALVLAALTARGSVCALRNVLRSEDTEVMVECLRLLGYRVLTEWPQASVFISRGADEPLVPAKEANLFVANSGTTMRFLTALVALGHGRYRLDGVPRMRERPIQDLLDALEQVGAVAYSENKDGCPPVVVMTRGLHAGTVRIKGKISSQFLSGLLLVAPFATGEMAIEVEGPLVSWPYVAMTLQMLSAWGIRFQESEHRHFRFAGIGPGHAVEAEVRPFQEGFDPRHHVPIEEYKIEPDASAASYFFAAAAITGGQVRVADLTARSIQGDVAFVDILEQMGCTVLHDPSGITVRGGPLVGVDVDMNAISDTVMTLAAVACFAQGPTTIRNVAHIRHKETDRLAALACELRRIGAVVEERGDGLTIIPQPLHGGSIQTYHDHRMAMSLALVGLKVPGIIINNPACVGKTYPDFFKDLELLRQ